MTPKRINEEQQSFQIWLLYINDQRHKHHKQLSHHLIVWVLKAEVPVLTEKETVVFRGSRGLSCHGRSQSGGGTSREVVVLLRRIRTAASDSTNGRRGRRGQQALQPHPHHHQLGLNRLQLEQMWIARVGG